MRKFLPLSGSRERGFTLIELLIAVTIIAIIAVISFVVFRNMTIEANDARRKADLKVLAKAYDVVYQAESRYRALLGSDFAGGQIPGTPEGNSYPCIVGPEAGCMTQATDRVAFCVSLGNNQSARCYIPSSSCFCTSASQGSAFTGAGGGEGPNGASCDPYGALVSGLIGYWTMDQTASPFSNVTGGNDAVWNGAVGSAQGRIANAGSFNGLNSYADSGNQPNFQIGQSYSYTIAAWIRPNTVSSYSQAIAGSGIWGSSGWGIQLNYAQVNCGSRGGGSFSYGAVANNAWYHVACTTFLTEQSLRRQVIYVNGSASPLNALGYPRSTTQSFRIGASRTSANPIYYFNGLIDDVRVYNRALPAQEINMLYNNGNGCAP